MKSLLGVLLMAAFLAGCNTDSLPPASGFTTVSGTIVDAATKTPVAGAVVTVDTVLTATTDASGKFAIEKVPSGIVDYTVTAKGYKVVTSTAEVEPSKPYELDLSLVAASP
ncbi:MAG: carboxypeptidase regulatory-like domain-containing protein [Candidatus Eremiobacteraeota bacterium]|nr:carboxypeptidase regulatory-like domain-containing protein [Candidatus Eremiobacteraeota bacterium]MBV8284624.1 carboxypeptidase regulatory-like domain-containing protein [Candidatus Eremiobacteraeota bacterium]MBV8333646.1 carboxypeptidase regulatory-like domain-containing protein [Candidatus Eremiobacteraeota bacterium]MBV8433564.1 carboxypeptidase regulatory-like domain-containing protein [Candidatus Eremiobacteraeota bacterium]MBV8582726.1 carboxypeptidase regulatory-like domain-containi